MMGFRLQEILKKLDPALYLRTDKVHIDKKGRKMAGIYRRKAVRKESRLMHKRQHTDLGHQKYMMAKASGDFDVYCGGACIGYIPEYDEFSPKTGALEATGWRTIAMRLHRQEGYPLEKLRRVFQCRGLGDCEYDRASLAGKLALQKRRYPRGFAQ